MQRLIFAATLALTALMATPSLANPKVSHPFKALFLGSPDSPSGIKAIFQDSATGSWKERLVTFNVNVDAIFVAHDPNGLYVMEMDLWPKDQDSTTRATYAVSLQNPEGAYGTSFCASTDGYIARADHSAHGVELGESICLYTAPETSIPAMLHSQLNGKTFNVVWRGAKQSVKVRGRMENVLRLDILGPAS